MYMYVVTPNISMLCKGEYTLLFYAKPTFSLSVMLSSENTLNSLSHAYKLINTIYLFHQAMDLFWELASTIALSLLLPLIFIKVLSVAPNLEANEKVSDVDRDHDHHDHGALKSDSQKWEAEEVVRIVGKIDEFRDKSIPRKIVVPEIVDANCQSPKIPSSGNFDENRVYNEIEVVDLAENPSEENSHDCSLMCECVVEESNVGIKINEVEVELDMMEWESSARKVEEVEISQCDEIDESMRKEEVGENRGLLDEEDDWEGIERTELEKLFGAAVVFVGSKINADVVANLSNDVKMKLYGYHRIATEGPCREPQPMALKFSARAKWNAWQQLGIMSPEMAMERYISLLSDNIPDWVADCPYGNAKPASADVHAFSELTL